MSYTLHASTCSLTQLTLTNQRHGLIRDGSFGWFVGIGDSRVSTRTIQRHGLIRDGDTQIHSGKARYPKSRFHVS